MTKITDISQLKVGDEVTLTVKGRISHVYPDLDDNYANLDFEEHAEYISISKEYLDDGLMTIERVAKPLPTENGVYVPASNVDDLANSYLYVFFDANENGPWTVFGPGTVREGEDAEVDAIQTHESFGGLVPLVAKG